MKFRITSFFLADEDKDIDALTNPVILALGSSDAFAEIQASPKLLDPDVVVRVELSVEVTTKKELDEKDAHLFQLTQ